MLPFLLFLKNPAVTWATCKSHFIINSETEMLRVFLASDDYVVADKHLGDEGWRQCKAVLFLLGFLFGFVFPFIYITGFLSLGTVSSLPFLLLS